MFIRLYRVFPLLVVLGIIAVILYLVVMFRTSPNHAKEVLIKAFTWLTGALSAFFLLVTLYALAEHNIPMTDLASSFLITSALALGITTICRLVFLHHHPQYRPKPIKTTWGKRKK
ncbi:MAG: guanylate cyclase [Raoultibacter sp.]